MKSILQNIIAYTHNLGFIDLVKITGTKDETVINAIAEDRSVIISGTLSAPCAEFIGTFGMPNLQKLKTILSFDDYDDDAKIKVTRRDRDDVSTPESIRFETNASDFVNDYRLMQKALVEERIKNVTYKGTGWDVTFEPEVANIMRLRKQAQANSEEKTFVTKLEKGDLRIYFGDPSTHSGNFVFAAGVGGTLTRDLTWPVSQVLSILSLPGDKIFRISDKGAIEIVVDSGMAVYGFLLPAQTK